MSEAMVTARMDESKKRAGARILARGGLNASQAVNKLYDRIIECGNADFLASSASVRDADAWARASRFVDALSEPRTSRFDGMTKAEIRLDRLRSRGTM